MSQANKLIKYRKLPGRSSTARLMQGPDHLLLVRSSGMAHQYRRFYFKDIQSLVLVRTRRHIAYSVILGLLLSLFGLRVIYAGWATFSGVMFALGSMMLVINILKGPCCSCLIQTRISLERVPLPPRCRRAQRACDNIHSLVVAEQGSFDAAAYEAALQQPVPQRPTAPVAVPLRTPPVHKAAVCGPIRGRSMTALALLLLGSAAATMLAMFGITVRVVPIILHLATAAMLIVVLVRYARRESSRGMRKTSWWTLGYLAVFLFIASIATTVHTEMTSPALPGLLLAVLRVVLACHAVILAGLGITGLVQVRRFHLQDTALPPPLSAGPPQDGLGIESSTNVPSAAGSATEP